jgi:hypothetical protein
MTAPLIPSQRDMVRASLLVMGSRTERHNSYKLNELRRCPKCGYPGGLIFCPRCHGKAA